MYFPILATALAKSIAPKTYIRGGGAKDCIKTVTSSMRRCPRGPKWTVSVRPPSSIPRAASTIARSRSSLPDLRRAWQPPPATARPKPRASGQGFPPSPIHPLHEDVDDPATRQPHPESLIIRDAIGQELGSPALYNGHRLLIDRGFDAPAANRPYDLPLLRDGHRGARSQRPRPLYFYDRGERCLFALLAPLCDPLDDRVHPYLLLCPSIF